MNLDMRIRDAVDETLTAPVDVDAGLVALRRTRRNRAVGRFGACAVVVALVLTGVLVRRHDSRPQPAPTPGPGPGGIVLSLSLGGTVEQVGSPRLTTLPPRVNSMGPFQFTSDGRRLIYAWQREVLSRDLTTGEDQPLEPCPNRYCIVSVDPAGTRVVTGHDHRLTVRDLTSGERRRYDVGRDFGAVTWSADGRTIALVTHRTGQESYSILDLDSGEVTRVVPLRGGLFVVPALSPDGTELAYIQGVAQGGHRMPRLELSVVPTHDGEPRVLHEVGQCYCIRYFPAVAWSPDGSRIAVTLSGTPVSSQVGGSVYTVRTDGTDWRLLASGHYQDRLVWQPVVTAGE